MKQYKTNIIKVPKFSEDQGFYTTATRSASMRKIGNRDTKPELKLRKVLWSLGYRYRVNMKGLPGSPDIVFTKKRLAIFIDGEFWHGYNWEIKKIQLKSNRDFWIPKIERNMQRDWENNKALIGRGFTVMRFWEKQINTEFNQCLVLIRKYLDDYVPIK